MALELHFWSLLALFETSFRSILAPSWRPGPPFASQVGLLGCLSACKLASWGVLGTPSWLPWPPGPPSWPPGSALGLQVGLLGRILASKLASWASFWPPSWPLGLALGLQVSSLASLWNFNFSLVATSLATAECAERLNNSLSRHQELAK